MSCRKHGLNCVAECTSCHGDNCSNASAVVESNDRENNEPNNEDKELEVESQDFEKANKHQESFYESDIDWIMEETEAINRVHKLDHSTFFDSMHLICILQF